MLTHRFKTILGDIPSDWSSYPLRDCIVRSESIAGDWGDETGDTQLFVLRSTNFTNDGHIDLSDVAARSFTFKKATQLQVLKDDILLERSGGAPDQPVGRVIIADEDMPGFGFGNFIHRLRPNSEIVHPGFLRWVLHEIHRCGVVERVQYQTTQMRNLDFRDYQRLLIPVPPTVAEQQTISQLICQSDSLIVQSKKMVGIRGSLHRDDMQGDLNAMKTGLLQSLLVGRMRLEVRSTEVD